MNFARASKYLGLCLALLWAGGVLGPSVSHASPRLKFSGQPVFQDEGDRGKEFNISLSSTAWTVIASSEPLRRSIIMQSAASNASTVCLLPSTTTAMGTSAKSSCTRDTPGMDLTVGSALTDYSAAQWVGRVVVLGSTQAVKGYWTYDRGDLGRLPE